MLVFQINMFQVDYAKFLVHADDRLLAMGHNSSNLWASKSERR